MSRRPGRTGSGPDRLGLRVRNLETEPGGENHTMFDLIKKTLFTGVGLAALTKEKLQDLGKEVSEKARLTEAQAQEFQAELEARASQAQKDLEDVIDQRVEQATQKLGLARRDQVEALAARIARLEAQTEIEASADRPPKITGF